MSNSKISLISYIFKLTLSSNVVTLLYMTDNHLASDLNFFFYLISFNLIYFFYFATCYLIFKLIKFSEKMIRNNCASVISGIRLTKYSQLFKLLIQTIENLELLVDHFGANGNNNKEKKIHK